MYISTCICVFVFVKYIENLIYAFLIYIYKVRTYTHTLRTAASQTNTSRSNCPDGALSASARVAHLDLLWARFFMNMYPPNYFPSSDPRPHTLFWHSCRHTIWKYLWHMYSDILSDTLSISFILFLVLSGSLSGMYSDIFLASILASCLFLPAESFWNMGVQVPACNRYADEVGMRSANPHHVSSCGLMQVVAFLGFDGANCCGKMRQPIQYDVHFWHQGMWKFMVLPRNFRSGHARNPIRNCSSHPNGKRGCWMLLQCNSASGIFGIKLAYCWTLGNSFISFFGQPKTNAILIP